MIKSIKRYFVMAIALLIAFTAFGTTRTVVHADEYYGKMSPSIGTFEKSEFRRFFYKRQRTLYYCE